MKFVSTGASATPFTVAVWPVTKQLDTCHKLQEAEWGERKTRSRMPSSSCIPPDAAASSNAFLRYFAALIDMPREIYANLRRVSSVDIEITL